MPIRFLANTTVMGFNKEKLLKLLKENGYQIHPHFQTYYNPKKSLGYMFHVSKDDLFVWVYKIKWNQLDLKEAPKMFRMKVFNPNQFDLKDKQAELLRLQGILDRQRHNKKVKEDLKKKKLNDDDNNENTGVKATEEKAYAAAAAAAAAAAVANNNNSNSNSCLILF